MRLKLFAAFVVLVLGLSSCIIIEEGKPYNVSYSATEASSSDTATLTYTLGDGSLATAADFTGTFEQFVSVDSNTSLTYSADNVTGTVTLTLSVSDSSDGSNVFNQERVCTSSCTITFTTP